MGGEKRGREEQRDEKGNQMGGGDGKKEAGQSKVAEGAESGSVKEGDVVPSKKVKNVPAHRGAFKRHLRKHTLLFQREGGKVAKGFIVTCIQVCCCASPPSTLRCEMSSICLTSTDCMVMGQS